MDQQQFYDMVNEIRLLAAIITKLASRDLEQRLDARQTGLSGLQHGLLRMLDRKNYTISELSRQFLLSPSTLVPAVDNLERRGLLQRGRDTYDRRRTPLVLTEAGRELVQSIPVIAVDDALPEGVKALAPEASQQLLLLLRELVQHTPEGEGILREISVRVPLPPGT